MARFEPLRILETESFGTKTLCNEEHLYNVEEWGQPMTHVHKNNESMKGVVSVETDPYSTMTMFGCADGSVYVTDGFENHQGAKGHDGEGVLEGKKCVCMPSEGSGWVYNDACLQNGHTSVVRGGVFGKKDGQPGGKLFTFSPLDTRMLEWDLTTTPKRSATTGGYLLPKPRVFVVQNKPDIGGFSEDTSGYISVALNCDESELFGMKQVDRCTTGSLVHVWNANTGIELRRYGGHGTCCKIWVGLVIPETFVNSAKVVGSSTTRSEICFNTLGNILVKHQPQHPAPPLATYKLEKRGSFKLPHGFVESMAVTRDKERLAVGTSEGVVLLFNLGSHDIEMQTSIAALDKVFYSHLSRSSANNAQPTTERFTASCTCVTSVAGVFCKMQSHRGLVYHVQFSRDGKQITSFSSGMILTRNAERAKATDTADMHRVHMEAVNDRLTDDGKKEYPNGADATMGIGHVLYGRIFDIKNMAYMRFFFRAQDMQAFIGMKKDEATNMALVPRLGANSPISILGSDLLKMCSPQTEFY
jgi:WD40 repeat protein